MKYIQIDISGSRQAIEPVVTALLEVGITDTVVEDPADIADLLDKKNEYDWDYIDESILELENETPKVTVFVEENEEGRAKLEEIRQAISRLKVRAQAGEFGADLDLGALDISVKDKDDSQWKDNWKEYFKPAKVGNTIVVKPTWEEYEAKSGEKIIEIDPGMAFGTGTHETTSLCIRLMEEYVKPGAKVLDVGCGSGILSVAAVLLGASEVLGVEIDPIAVEIAKENIELNKVGNVAKAQQGDLTKGIDFRADVIVANLMADLVMTLSADVAKHLLPGGIYISSGILTEKAVLVADTMRSLGFRIMEVKEDGMWCAIVAKM